MVMFGPCCFGIVKDNPKVHVPNTIPRRREAKTSCKPAKIKRQSYIIVMMKCAQVMPARWESAACTP